MENKRKARRVKGGRGGGKLADSGGAYIPTESVPAKKKMGKLKPMDFTTGGRKKNGSTGAVVAKRKRAK